MRRAAARARSSAACRTGRARVQGEGARRGPCPLRTGSAAALRAPRAPPIRRRTAGVIRQHRPQLPPPARACGNPWSPGAVWATARGRGGAGPAPLPVLRGAPSPCSGPRAHPGRPCSVSLQGWTCKRAWENLLHRYTVQEVAGPKKS